MEPVIIPQVAALAGGGLIGGLVLLVRGFTGYRSAAGIADTSTSRISAIAIGEVRVSGVVETAGLTLVSPLQSAACVYYRASIRASDGELDRTVLDEERAVGFRIRDGSGSVRVFPRGASFDVPTTFEDSSSSFGGPPPGLRLRTGSAFGAFDADRDAQIAALLTVRPAAAGAADADDLGWSFGGGLASLGTRPSGRTYREARIEPGAVVTVVGQVLPFDQIDDPQAADAAGSSLPGVGVADPEIAADMAAARAAGVLEASAADAWGNAAIPGFGIGAPVSMPELDAGAAVPALGDAAAATAARAVFDIGPHELVLAAAPGAPLLIALGPPGAAVARHERRFIVGLLGAILAIGSAVALAVMAGGGFGA